MSDAHEVTLLLSALSRGDEDAGAKLIPVVYNELRRLAGSYMQLQNAAGFGFHDRLHHQLAAAVQHGDYGRFLVHIHTDILNVATHSVASLGERSFAFNGVFPSRYSAILEWLFPASFCHPTVLDQIFTRPFSHNALTLQDYSPIDLLRNPDSPIGRLCNVSV